MAISDDTASAAAASLVATMVPLLAQRRAEKGIALEDPRYHVKALYAEMLDFVREQHGLPRGTAAGSPADWKE